MGPAGVLGLEVMLRPDRWWLVVPAVVLCVTVGEWVAGIGSAQAVLERPHCEVCRRFADTSPCRMQVTLVFGRHAEALDLCSVRCFCELMEGFDEDQLRSVLVVDHATLALKQPLMQSVKRATFLYGTSGDEQKTREPYVLAFTSESDAEKAKEDLGGDLMNWEEVREVVVQLVTGDEGAEEAQGSTERSRKR